MSKFTAHVSDLVKPVGGTHAIEQISVGIEWRDDLDHALMEELSQLLDPVGLGMRRKIELRSSEVSGDGGDTLQLPGSSQAELTAIFFDNGGEEDQTDDDLPTLLVKRDGLLFRVKNNYEGWTCTRRRADELISLILSFVLQHRAVESIGLQVVDAFLLESSTLDFEIVLNRDCDYIPPKVFNAKGHWHFDQGFFEHEILGERLLTGIKLTHRPAGPKGKLTITCLHRFDLSPTRPISLSIEDFSGRYDVLYQKNKALINDLLQREVSKLIGLVPAEGVKA